MMAQLRRYTTLWQAVQVSAGLLLVVAAVVLYAGVSDYKLLSVASDSMYPALRHGDAVLRTKRVGQLAAGDVVTFRSPIVTMGQTLEITHRVIAVDKKRGMVRTKGDHLMTPDSEVAIADITGKIIYAVPKVGLAVDFVRRPAGLMLVLYIPAFGIVWEEIRRLKTYYNRAPRHYVLRRV